MLLKFWTRLTTTDSSNSILIFIFSTTKIFWNIGIDMKLVKTTVLIVFSVKMCNFELKKVLINCKGSLCYGIFAQKLRFWVENVDFEIKIPTIFDPEWWKKLFLGKKWFYNGWFWTENGNFCVLMTWCKAGTSKFPQNIFCDYFLQVTWNGSI